MPLDKTKLGTRYTCFSCGTKFWDLNRPVPTCPECEADQNEAPVQDLKALLTRHRRNKAQAAEAVVEEVEEAPKASETDDTGLFDATDSEPVEEEE